MRKSITKVTKSGRVRRRPARPRMSLGDKLSNLHLLLRVPSFAQWPLALHFFSDDVYQRWMRCAKDATIELRSGMKITLNFQNTEAERASARDIGACERSIVEGPCQGGIESLDSSYAPYKTHLAKSLFILADGELVHCVVCGHGIRTPDAMGLVCPNDECRAASHVTCLASKFLRGEANRNLLPVRGNCPSCNLQLQWSRLVTELSLRLRGSKEIVQLQRKACKRKINEASVKTAHGLCSTVDDDAENDIDDVDQQDTDEELSIGDVVDEPLIDEAQNHPLSDMDDTRSVHSAISDNSQFSDLRSPAKSNVPESRLNTVIEDSDWDAAEVLD
ncbi:Slx4p interacting protein [Xylographa carneopallida]|nr:Slx4p interacting protein [Xylographa carneopallida]